VTKNRNEKARMEDGGWKMENAGELVFSILHLLSSILVFIR
jgi:hypothetical protein